MLSHASYCLSISHIHTCLFTIFKFDRVDYVRLHVFGYGVLVLEGGLNRSWLFHEETDVEIWAQFAQ
jgi:hypothetical protein